MNIMTSAIIRKSILFCCVSLSCTVVFAQETADSLLNFIQRNKARASLYLTQNDTILARLNENTMMPLASTVKIMVALEFAKQAAAKVVDEKSYIALSELNKYYLPNTDGGAHPNWLAFEKSQGHLKTDSVQLINVARGMTIFSSNANTEFLCDLLGYDNVKNNVQLLSIRQHSAIYPFVGSLFMYQNPRKKTEESILKGINRLSEQEYARYAYDMHNALKFDTVLKAKFRPQDLSNKMQKAWSDRLPASTTKEYVHLVRIINNRKFFDDKTYRILSAVLETLMENPANARWLKHAGMKGGSTPWILTKALYATTQNGTRIEMAYFFNNLDPQENARLQKWTNSFELEILSNPAFRQKMIAAFK
ncbi:MAG: hypothetical protein JWQ27_2870 [Ferruginibacter sp.]|nr:hypothetical protein [Ferruginibacter sp.]